MKKILLMIVLFFLSFAIFAEGENSKGSENQNAAKVKTLGGSVGLRISILGLEPTASIIYKKLEIEAFCPIASNGIFEGSFSDNTIGYMPGASFGYLSKGFERGWQNGVGGFWYWITPEYIDTFLAYGGAYASSNSSSSGTYSSSSVEGPDIHAFGIYYKGGIRFKSGCNLYFRMLFPLALYAPSERQTITIINREALAAAALGWLLTQSIGFRYSF
ncbi:MAG: hypothetical protein IJR49_04310 [Treponema sp.]|nr:hypothetical protein [Treponema sp.]